MKDKILLTTVSFLSYFIMATVISSIGIISTDLAAHFEVDITDATAVFSFLTTGLLIGSLLAIFIFDLFGLKRMVIIQSISLTSAIIVIVSIHSFWLLSIFLLLIGINLGILLSSAAIVISRIYQEKMRASMLLLTDSFYSIGGVLSTWVVSYFLSQNMFWGFAYALPFVFTLIVVLSAFFSRFPEEEKDIKTNEEAPSAKNFLDKSDWPVSVIICGLGLFFYLLGFVTIISWLPQYAKATFAETSIEYGQLITYFFVGQFISQLVMFFLVHKISMKKIIIICSCIPTAISFLIWNVQTFSSLNLVMIALGLVGGGLLKVSFGFGTLLLKRPSNKSIGFLVFCTGLGSSLSPYLSSKIVEMYNTKSALQFASLLYLFMVFAFILMLLLNSRAKDLKILSDNSPNPKNSNNAEI